VLAFIRESVINTRFVLTGNEETAVRLGAALILGSALDLNQSCMENRPGCEHMRWSASERPLL